MRRALVRLELLRLAHDPVTLLVAVVLPVMFQLGYALTDLGAQLGPATDSRQLQAALMVGVAAYGSATAATALAGQAVVDRLEGWGRQLALTPVTDRDVVVAKAAVSLVGSTLPVTAVFATAAATGLRLPWSAWLGCGLVVLAGSPMWSAYGLAVALTGRSQSSAAAASAGLVLLAFAGGVFLPLGGVLQQVGRFSPMYGYVWLARWPLQHGAPLLPSQSVESAATMLAATAAWALLFGIAAARQVSRARER